MNPISERTIRFHYRSGERARDVAGKYLDSLLSEERPFFLFVHFMDPHAPYVPPEGFKGRISDPGILPPGTDSSDPGEPDLRFYLRNCLRTGEGEWEPHARYLHDLYREEVMYLDSMVGSLLRQVEESGQPTVFGFTSDHGESFGEHGNVAHAKSLFEPQISVPFILSGPGVPRGRELGQPPALVDMARTLLEHASESGVDVSLIGADGSNVLREGPSSAALSVFGFPVSEGWLQVGSIIREGWKLHFEVRYTNPVLPVAGEFKIHPIALYNLANDPKERVNRLEESPEKVVALSEAATLRFQDDLMPSLEDRNLSRPDRLDLAELGYLQWEY
jgi:arylsulfatase A-like enzyme